MVVAQTLGEPAEAFLKVAPKTAISSVAGTLSVASSCPAALVPTASRAQRLFRDGFTQQPQAKAAASQAIWNQLCAEKQEQAGDAPLRNRERQHALRVSRKKEAATLFVEPELVEML